MNGRLIILIIALMCGVAVVQFIYRLIRKVAIPAAVVVGMMLLISWWRG